jgi:hypothetical protein
MMALRIEPTELKLVLAIAAVAGEHCGLPAARDRLLRMSRQDIGGGAHPPQVAA